MSYVRVGEDGSHVYIYAGVNGVVCAGCTLGPDLVTWDLAAMLGHITAHRAKTGWWAVPGWVDEALRKGWPTPEERP